MDDLSCAVARNGVRIAWSNTARSCKNIFITLKSYFNRKTRAYSDYISEPLCHLQGGCAFCGG